jgi:hypothetical protein
MASGTGKMMEGLSAMSRRFMRMTDKVTRILFIAEYCTPGKLLTQGAPASGAFATHTMLGDQERKEAVYLFGVCPFSHYRSPSVRVACVPGLTDVACSFDVLHTC